MPEAELQGLVLSVDRLLIENDNYKLHRSQWGFCIIMHNFLMPNWHRLKLRFKLSIWTSPDSIDAIER